MKIKSVRYEMLRVTKQYENDKACVEVELQDGDDLPNAIIMAKTAAHAALSAPVAKPDPARTFKNEVAIWASRLAQSLE